MNTCKVCKFWGNRSDDISLRLKSCDAPKIKYGYGNDFSEIADNGALIEDDEGWGMLTGPDFGCVLYETRKRKKERSWIYV